MNFDLGYEMLCKGWRQNLEDKLYQRWIVLPLEAQKQYPLQKFINDSFGESYRKSTEQEKQDILNKYGGQ